ncbi:MAG TPA: enoyl-CoA hydratase-related protein [Vicinamibacterales bacterium]|nr:enoyl-CoA hydratase-related protein [Vicinamibacterales bacterium]
MPTIAVTSGPFVTVTLNRPEVRNAFNEELIADLTSWAEEAARTPGIRAAVLRGAGRTFCAGADVNWMAKTVTYTREQNLEDARRMRRMFERLDELPFPVIGRVHGAALGGGAGLAAICDMVVAAADATFGFTEVKLGILPAVISPFALRKIGVSAARELFLTGARFSAMRAKEIGLVHAVVTDAELDDAVDAFLREIGTAAPEAVREAKRLIRDVAGRVANEADITTEAIAARRVSAEGQEGLGAFLEKRKARWISDT